MAKPRKKKAERRRPKPVLIRSDELCKELVSMAAFSLYDQPAAQVLVYKAVKQLQRLDAAAVEAGILPRR